jgi:DNA-binding NtrC family response regulator
MTPSLLLVDDEPAIRFSYVKYLSRAGFSVQDVATLSEARKAATSQRFDALLLDLNLPDGNGMDWISEVRELQPDIAIVVITGVGDIPSAVEAMRRGADHYLVKPVNMGDLEVFLLKCLELGTLRRRSLANRRLTKAADPFFGENASFVEVRSLIQLASENESAVLLQGETGTGKGVFARWIHAKSSRSSMPFVEVNCSSLRGELLSSELFGHAKGAFTSAVEPRQGLLDVADGGTLFLDEIGDMDPGIQSQFLKVIEEKRYRRLGEVQERRSDFRLICATNRDLPKEVQQGTFRRDLFFRINLLPIEIPPLRSHLEDLPALITYILQTLAAGHVRVSEDAIRILQEYLWPGNIREVRNVLERGLLLSRRSEELTPGHFPGLGNSQKLLNSEIVEKNTEDMDVLRVLNRFHGDREKAAQELGISRATLYRKLKQARNKGESH